MAKIPHDNRPPRSPSQLNRKQWFLHDMKLAKSCFFVVICFFASYVSAFLHSLRISDIDTIAIKKWITTFLLMNACLDSVVFFCRTRRLRRESLRILKQVFCNALGRLGFYETCEEMVWQLLLKNWSMCSEEGFLNHILFVLKTVVVFLSKSSIWTKYEMPVSLNW